jgi:hypothetical protein
VQQEGRTARRKRKVGRLAEDTDILVCIAVYADPPTMENLPHSIN